jgi:hypothetical protein
MKQPQKPVYEALNFPRYLESDVPAYDEAYKLIHKGHSIDQAAYISKVKVHDFKKIILSNFDCNFDFDNTPNKNISVFNINSGVEALRHVYSDSNSLFDEHKFPTLKSY